MKSLIPLLAVAALTAGLGACSETTTKTTSMEEASVVGPAGEPVLLERKSSTVKTRHDD